MHIKHLAVDEDRQKKSKAITYNLRGDDIILHCKPFSSGFKNYQKRFTNPILFPHYMLCLSNSNASVAFRIKSNRFPEIVCDCDLLEILKKNHFSIHIILCLKLCYNSEKI